jgi:hypothetical protein
MIERSHKDAETALWTLLSTRYEGVFHPVDVCRIQRVNRENAITIQFRFNGRSTSADSTRQAELSRRHPEFVQWCFFYEKPSHEPSSVTQLMWLSNFGMYLALASYSRAKGGDGVVKVAAVLQSTHTPCNHCSTVDSFFSKLFHSINYRHVGITTEDSFWGLSEFESRDPVWMATTGQYERQNSRTSVFFSFSTHICNYHRDRIQRMDHTLEKEEERHTGSSSSSEKSRRARKTKNEQQRPIQATLGPK